jgi:diaminohydroxyphosphoribosylaminopyrimidine deaminase / 5-amino-6-(5-phosphoribosylamino)uracil reductase
MSSSEFDCLMMQRCLELARTASGLTAPNPLVGSVIVQDGKVVGEGFHPKAGEPHAEVFALRQAGEAARGATLYVNLEPCSHFGRTPPCAMAIVETGLARVVVGMVDPNPKVSGNGIAQLQEAGIAVTVGVEEADCRRLNEAFIHRMLHHQPFGILKYAMTLDGQIAAPTGHSQWITSPAARQAVHQLRSTCDAVIVGGNTVRQDNPHLTSHGVAAHNPLRVVMSRSLDLPTAANLWQTDIAPTIVFTETSSNPTLQTHLQQQGVEVITTDSLKPEFVMQTLYDRGCLTVLWECGGTLAASAIQAGAVQKLWAFIAPKLIGGSHFTPIGDLGREKMSEAVTLRDLKIDPIGPDWRIEAYLE